MVCLMVLQTQIKTETIQELQQKLNMVLQKLKQMSILNQELLKIFQLRLRWIKMRFRQIQHWKS